MSLFSYDLFTSLSHSSQQHQQSAMARAGRKALLFAPLVFSMSTLMAEEQQDPQQTEAKQHDVGIVITGEIAPSTSLSPHQDTLSQQALSSSGGHTLLLQDDLRQRRAGNMAEALAIVPGLYFTEATGSDSFFVSVRGSNLDTRTFSTNGLYVSRDGLPLTYADGSTDGQILDPQWSRAIVVRRGARALLAGGSSLGGSIEMYEPTGYNANNDLELRLEAGSFGYRALRGMAAWDDGVYDAWVGASHTQQEGFRGHSQAQTIKSQANVGWRGTAWQHRLGLHYSESDQELPGGLSRQQMDEDRFQANPNAELGDYRRDLRVSGGWWRSAWSQGDTSAVVGVSYSFSDLDHPIVNRVVLQPPAPPIQVFDGLWVQRQRSDVGSSLRLEHRFDDQHRLWLGIDAGYASMRGTNAANIDGERGDISARINDSARQYSLTLVHEWQLTQDLLLDYGVQLSRHERRSGSLSANYHGLSPRLGLNYALAPEHSIFASIGRLWEAPTLVQLQDANDPERALRDSYGMSVEAGLRGSHEWGHGQALSYELTGFASQLQREILAQEDPQAPGTSINDNADRTERFGIETLLRANTPIQGDWRLNSTLSYTLSYFRFDDDDLFGDNILPAVPRHHLRAELMLESPWGFSSGPTLSAASHRWVDFANTERAHGHGLLGWRANYSNQRGLSLWLEARNLTNREWIASTPIQADSSQDGATFSPGEPRSLYAGLEVSY